MADAAAAGTHPPRVLTSTTSHKREPLLLTLELFGRLGLRDIDLNLHHVLEVGVPVADVASTASRSGLGLWVVSGGWCDFYHSAPDIRKTFESVARQVAIARELGVSRLRLFFGRLHFEHYTRDAFATIRDNLSRLSDAHPDIVFAFENHDGASLHPEVCVEVLSAVGRPNILMNFDPINFAKVGVDPLGAARQILPFVGHVHLKGLERGEYCEFGEGDVDLGPTLQALHDGGYRGGFSVEYEGRFDGTVRLYRSVQRARAALGDAPARA